MSRVIDKSISIKFLLTSFSIPFLIRLIPELISYPYPLGFDTVTSYLFKMVEEPVLQSDLPSLLKTTSLYYIIQELLFRLIGDPILTLKILGPILYGLMLSSIAIYIKITWKIDNSWIYLGQILTGLSILALRLGWDLYRNMLGLSLAVLTLALINHNSKKVRYLSIFTAFLTSLAHELATVFLASVLLLTPMLRRDLDKDFTVLHIFAFTVSSSVFIYQRINVTTLSIQIPIKILDTELFSMIGKNLIISYIFLFFPLLLLGLASWKLIGNKTHISIWLSLVVILSVIPLTRIVIVPPYRIIIMAIFPLMVLITSALIPISKFKGLKLFLSLILIIYVLLSGSLYLVSTPRNGYTVISFVHNNLHKDIVRDYPSGYLQNTMSLEDIEAFKNELLKYKENQEKGIELILPKIFWWTYIQFPELYEGINLNLNDSLIKINYFEGGANFSSIDSTLHIIWWNHEPWYGINLQENFNTQLKNDSSYFKIYELEL